MAERKYSVAEIDQMRSAVQSILWATGFNDVDSPAEDRLRTYMLNGTEPDELEEAAKQAQAAWRERRAIEQEMFLAQQRATHPTSAS